ncbi:uncharacterized protein LOC119293605 [Triticum dicoccoides]|uniref:uncharacterized protein LOC119293605 n=1 Tax=Triticum dicoccoides TaxID=85692 RepID=UPI00188FA7EB|nr:uncharacterized protein LOC119293605 [Triticum dicoccoides]
MSPSHARSSATFSSSLSHNIPPGKMAASPRPAPTATQQKVRAAFAKALSCWRGVPNADASVCPRILSTGRVPRALTDNSDVHGRRGALPCLFALSSSATIATALLSCSTSTHPRCDSIRLGICGEACLIALRFRTIFQNKLFSLATDLEVRSQLTPIVVQQLILEVSVRQNYVCNLISLQRGVFMG